MAQSFIEPLDERVPRVPGVDEELELVGEQHQVVKQGVEVWLELESDQLAPVRPVDVAQHVHLQADQLTHRRLERQRKLVACASTVNRKHITLNYINTIHSDLS